MAYQSENSISWTSQQDRWRTLIKVQDPNIKCLPFHGLGHALIDLMYGLKEFWPTRRRILCSSSGSPNLQEGLQNFLREGYVLTILEKNNISALENWIQEGTNENLVAILVRDHCLLGEIQWNDQFLKKLNEKRIPHIEIQFGWSWSRAQDPLTFGSQIRVINDSKAIALTGLRFKTVPHSAALMNWSEIHWESEIQRAKDQFQEDELVLNEYQNEFLKSQTGPTVFNFEGLDHLKDRLLLFTKGINADFFLETLFERIQEPPLALPGFETRCETTHLSRWKGLRPCWSWWGPRELTEEEQRTLVIFSISFLKNKLTPQIIKDVYTECLNRIKVPSKGGP